MVVWMRARGTLAFRVGIGIVVIGILTLVSHAAVESWQVTSRNRNTRTLAEIAAYAETRLPRNAVLLVELDATERRNTDDHLRLMFLMSKTAHPFRTGETWKEKAAKIHKAGGIPYIVSLSMYSLPVVFTSRTDKRTLYSISEELTDETP